MKIGQLIEYITTEIFFFKNYTENKVGRLVGNSILKKKLNMRYKQAVHTLVSIYFGSPQLGIK